MRLIDADKVLNIVAAYCPDDDGSCSKASIDLREMLDEIEALSEIEAEPVTHGHWIEKNDWIACSNCNHDILDDYYEKRYKYTVCPHCGAKMGGNTNNET